jgi:adenylate cyclase
VSAEVSAASVAALEDALLGGPRDLTLADTARAAGVREDEVALFWQALGLPAVGPAERAFTADDASVIGAFVRAAAVYELSADAGVSMVRAIGHSAERLVTWQTETVIEHLARRYGLANGDARRLLLDRLPEVSALLERGLAHAWRRHVAAMGHRVVADVVADAAGETSDELPLLRATGFADVVGFTTRTAELGARALADYVQGFEARARDVVTAGGGRVVKTIGDAVLFVADDPVTGARVALGLAAAFGPDSASPVRVGLVWGRLLSRFGDVFGPSVNLAARLTDEAGPGRVLLDEVTARRLGEEGGFVLEPLPEREVAGLGSLRPVLLVGEV